MVLTGALKTLSTWSGLASLAGALTLGLAAVGPAAAEPAMWTVRDADSTIVLFGSVHLLPDGLDWRPRALEAALAKADDLWFETPVDDASAAQVARIAQQRGYLPAGQSLTAMLSPEGQKRLARQAGKLGLSPAALDRLTPWLADVSLSVAALARQGAGTDSGVERTLAQAAPAARRQAFETGAEQIAFFADLPLAEQLASLEDTLRQLDEDPGFYDELVGAWMAGDVRALQSLGLDPMKQASAALYERLIVARNRRWVETIRQRLAGSGETVIIVGAGHLVGPDGVPALLRARGIHVEGP